jgi:hypothetical protein
VDAVASGWPCHMMSPSSSAVSPASPWGPIILLCYSFQLLPCHYQMSHSNNFWNRLLWQKVTSKLFQIFPPLTTTHLLAKLAATSSLSSTTHHTSPCHYIVTCFFYATLACLSKSASPALVEWGNSQFFLPILLYSSCNLNFSFFKIILLFSYYLCLLWSPGLTLEISIASSHV